MSLRRRKVLALSKALAASSLLAGCTVGSSVSTDSPRDSPGDSRATTVPAPPSATETRARSTTATERSPDVGAGVDDRVRSVTAGNVRFGVDLLHETSADDRNANLLFSPYSVGVALAMTYAGARGETRTEMRETLGYPFGGEELHAAVEELSGTLVPDDQPETPTPTPTPAPDEERLHVPLRLYDANALWGQSGFPFSEAFLALLQQYYGAGLR